MESGSFQSQVLCVMEVLAKAAVAEINRRVDDSCAVLRLEVSQSRRDIDLLRRKCEVMEAELRRTRMRARRRGFAPPAAERQRTDWDRREDAEPRNQPADPDPADETEHMQIKEERSEDDSWQNRREDKRTSGPEEPSRFQVHQTDNVVDQYHSADTGPVASTADLYNTSPEQQVNRTQTETDFVVKLEKEEPDENAAPLDLGHRLSTQEGEGETWSHRGPVDPNFFCVGQEFGQISTVDTVPRIQSVGKPVVVGAEGMKRVRWFGSKRPQPDEEPNALSQVNCISPQQPQHQNRDSARHQDEGPTAQSRAAFGFRGHGRASWGAPRRARTPWTTGVCEKRFDCTYCGRGFTRFSQLKEHQRSHTGEKPFSCALCGRSFTKQCNLIRHAVVHSGEKPHECALCGKCFTQRSSLKSHQKTAH